MPGDYDFMKRLMEGVRFDMPDVIIEPIPPKLDRQYHTIVLAALKVFDNRNNPIPQDETELMQKLMAECAVLRRAILQGYYGA